MPHMDREEPNKETISLASLSIEEKTPVEHLKISDTLPPTPSGPETAPPTAPEPRPAPANGSFPYAAYSGQSRAIGGPGIVAPRQLPPYAAAQKAARGDGPGSGGSSTGWGGMPLSPHGPASPAAAAGTTNLPSSLTDQTDGGLGIGSGGASAAETASEPGTASEGAAGAPPPPRRRSSRGPGGPGGARSPCAFFLKTGSCAYGDRCKFDHPYEKAPKVVYNSMGLPMRPEEPPCSFYMKHAHCAFGHTCKYHHPELAAGAAPPPPPGGGGAAPPPQHHPPPPTMVAFPQGHATMAHPFYAAAAMQYQQMAAAGRLPDGAAVPHPMTFAFYRGGVPAGTYPAGMSPHQLPPGTMYAFGPAAGGMMHSNGRDSGNSNRSVAGSSSIVGGGGQSSQPSSQAQSRQDSGLSPLGSPRVGPRPSPPAAAAMGLPMAYTPKPLMVFNSPGKAEMAAAESD